MSRFQYCERLKVRHGECRGVLLTHGVEGGVAGLGGGGGVCLRAGSGLRVSVFGGEGETRRDFGVHYTPLVLVRADFLFRITHRQQRLLFTVQHILVSILSLPRGAMLRTKLFPEALQHDRQHQVFTMDRRHSR